MKNSLLTIGLACLIQSVFAEKLPLPIASFNYSANNLNVSFSNTSANATSYFWFFGDAASGGQNVSTAANPTHHFSAPGTYVVELTASNSEGSHTVSQTLSVTCPPLSVNLSAAGNTAICPGTVVDLNATPGFANYTWLLDGGPISGVSGPVFQSNIPGNFSVIASDGQGCSATSNVVSMSFLPLALPQFNWEKYNLRLTTENNSTDVDLNSWDFGDGSPISHEVSPVHYFPAPGTYTVVLTVSNGCTARTSQYDINFTCPPQQAEISTPGIAEACPASAIPLNATPGYSHYLWLMNGDSINWVTDATFWANQEADYTVVVTEETGCTGVSQPFHVNQKPAAEPSFISSADSLTVSFSNTSAHANTYLWDFGDGSPTSTEANPKHVFPKYGFFSVRLIATNECGSVTLAKIVEVPCPDLTVSLSTGGVSAVCPGESFTVQASLVGFYIYRWSINIMLQPPIIGPAGASLTGYGPGNYYLFVSNNLGCQEVSNVVFIDQKLTVEPYFTTLTNNLTASFSNTSENATSYSWDFGDGSAIDSTANPTHQFPAPGTYQVVLTAANDCGSQAFTRSVEVSCPNLAMQVSPTDTTVCIGQKAMLSATPGFQTYKWFLNGNPIPFATSATLFPDTQGGYSVMGFDAQGCSSASANASVVLKLLPVASFSFQKNDLTVSFSNTSQNADIFNWNFGDGQTSAEPNPTHEFSLPGNFIVTLVASNACGSETATQTVSPTVSTFLPEGIESLSVFPNPTNGNFYLKLNLTEHKSLNINLLNVVGQNVERRFVELPSGEAILNFENDGLPSGVYFLEVFDFEKRAVVRLEVF